MRVELAHCIFFDCPAFQIILAQVTGTTFAMAATPDQCVAVGTHESKLKGGGRVLFRVR